MTERPPVPPVLAHFECHNSVTRVAPLGNAGGFSGARLWRITAGNQVYCLRRWPAAHPTREHLRWIHCVQRTARDHGVTPVPRLERTVAGETFVEFDAAPWELSQWMPGAADFSQHPSPIRLAAALETLARFHHAVRHLGPRGEPGEPVRRISEGVVFRAQRARELSGGRLDVLRQAVARRDLGMLQPLALQICSSAALVAERVADQLEPYCRLPVEHQPALRDIWHDHLLFVGDEVSGLVDYGAMRYETVALDVARLLGSLAGDDAPRWQMGWSAYQRQHTGAGLSAETDFWQLVLVLDAAAVLLSGVQWLEWLVLEERKFERMDLVAQRMNENVQRLVLLVNRGGRPVLSL